MPVREFFQSCRKSEHPVFLRVFDALPEGELDYRPHERSPTAAQIVSTMVSELRSWCELVATGEIDWKPAAPKSLSEMIAEFERHQADLESRVAQLADEHWTRKCRCLVQGEVKVQKTLGEFLWFFRFDAIHHRG